MGRQPKPPRKIRSHHEKFRILQAGFQFPSPADPEHQEVHPRCPDAKKNVFTLPDAAKKYVLTLLAGMHLFVFRMVVECRADSRSLALWILVPQPCRFLFPSPADSDGPVVSRAGGGNFPSPPLLAPSPSKEPPLGGDGMSRAVSCGRIVPCRRGQLPVNPHPGTIAPSGAPLGG